MANPFVSCNCPRCTSFKIGLVERATKRIKAELVKVQKERDTERKLKDDARRLICQMNSTSAQDSDYYNHTWTREQEAEKRDWSYLYETKKEGE